MGKWSDFLEDFMKYKKVRLKWVKNSKSKYKNLSQLFKKGLKPRNKNLIKLNC